MSGENICVVPQTEPRLEWVGGRLATTLRFFGGFAHGLLWSGPPPALN